MCSCSRGDSKFGLVEMFHDAPVPPQFIPRTVIGEAPVGVYDSHKPAGIIVMDTGADYQGETSLTYLTNLLERYVNASGKGDLPFHYFIDKDGIIFQGRQDMIPAKLHEGSPFLYRPNQLDEQELLMARMARVNKPRLKLDNYLVICFLGDYNETLLNEEQEASLYQLLAHRSHIYFIPLQNIHTLDEIYPSSNNPGFYLKNYIQPYTLEQNIPPSPLKHPFMVMPEGVEN